MSTDGPESDTVQALFDAAPIALALCDAELRVVRVNRLYADFTSQTARDAVGRALHESWPHALAAHRAQITDIHHTQHAELPGVEFRRGDTRCFADITIKPFGASGTSWLCACVDVTEREELAQKLEEQARTRGSQAARLEHLVDESARQLQVMRKARERERHLAAVGQLAAGVMHDVNNILNPILAAAYLVDASAGDAAAVKEYAVRITHAAEMGVSRLARLMQFIRQEPVNNRGIDPVNLSQAVEEVLALAAPLWDRRAPEHAVVIERQLSPSVVVRGAAPELRAAMLNLVHNAVDAMSGMAGALTISVEERDGFAVVEFRDAGVGMAADVLERAFEPFFSTKGSHGTGLGLAEVYGIVKRHRGITEIDSAPGKGTVVRMRFPLFTPGP
jgi:PAS domain S-box-containing protein